MEDEKRKDEPEIPFWQKIYERPILLLCAGLLVMFPSSLVHGVRIYQGDRPRVCVAFNARPRSETM